MGKLGLEKLLPWKKIMCEDVCMNIGVKKITLADTNIFTLDKCHNLILPLNYPTTHIFILFKIFINNDSQNLKIKNKQKITNI